MRISEDCMGTKLPGGLLCLVLHSVFLPTSHLFLASWGRFSLSGYEFVSRCAAFACRTSLPSGCVEIPASIPLYARLGVNISVPFSFLLFHFRISVRFSGCLFFFISAWFCASFLPCFSAMFSIPSVAHASLLPITPGHSVCQQSGAAMKATRHAIWG